LKEFNGGGGGQLLEDDKGENLSIAYKKVLIRGAYKTERGLCMIKVKKGENASNGWKPLGQTKKKLESVLTNGRNAKIKP